MESLLDTSKADIQRGWSGSSGDGAELFASISVHALRCYGIDVRFAHLDTTAMSLQGDYDFEQDDETDEEQVIRITYGHSKDHRPDLKQAVLGMICANRTSIPIYLGAISGNTSDKTSLSDMAATYLAQFGEDEETPILIADALIHSINLLSVEWHTPFGGSSKPIGKVS